MFMHALVIERTMRIRKKPRTAPVTTPKSSLFANPESQDPNIATGYPSLFTHQPILTKYRMRWNH
jgi:hypothetical protein